MIKQPLNKTTEQYAKALFEVANEKKSVTKVLKDIKNIQNAVPDKNLLQYLNSPLLKESQKKELIQTFSKLLKLNIITKNFLNVLVKDGHLNDLETILNAFNNINLKKNNMINVFVETAEPLSEIQEKRLKLGLEKKLKKEVILSYKLNENLLGGLILYYDSIQIDDSLEHKLKNIETIMKGLK